tara:strand:- start:160 stop:369 length:210 start_codon:yes stop_codon:yes gene_type:complete
MKVKERIYYIKGLIDNELTNTKNKIYVNLMQFEDNNKQNPQDIELRHALVEVGKQIEKIIKELKQQKCI